MTLEIGVSDMAKKKTKEVKRTFGIPESEYKQSSEFTYVTRDLIVKYHTLEEANRFFDWMYGQTCSAGENGETAIYSWDYERWLREGKKKEQNAATWD